MDYTVDDQKSLLEALASDDCSKIILSQDVELEDKLSITSNVEFDLNGYKLWIGSAEGVTVSKGKVSFYNGTIVSPEDDPIVSENSGTVVTLGADLKFNATKCAVYVKNKGKVVIDGAEIESLGDHAAVFVEGSGTAKENSTLVMKSGEIIATQQIAVSVKSRGIFVFKGGRLESKVDAKNKDKTSTVYLNGAGTRMEMTDGEIYSEFTSALSVIEGASIELSGGLISTQSTTEPVVFVQGSKSSFEMTGGKLSSESTDGILIGGLERDQFNTLSITGGVIAVPIKNKCIATVAGEGQSVIQITGGRFHGDLDNKFVAVGYVMEKDELGYWVVKNAEDIDPVPDYPPEPGPQPGPEPGPSPGPTPYPPIVNKLGLLDRSTPVYGSPSNRFVICHVVGSVWVLSDGYVDNETGDRYSYVSYVLAGVGGRGTGYILSSLITIKEG